MNTNTRLLGLALICIPLIGVNLYWDRLPERVAIHFDSHGQVDRLGSRQEWLGTLFITVLVLSFLRIIVLNVVDKQPALTRHQRVMIYLLTAGFMGLALVLSFLQGIRGEPIYQAWNPVLFSLLGSGLMYYGVPAKLPVNSNRFPESNFALTQELAFRQRIHELSRLVTMRVNLLAVVIMLFVAGQDRWSVGILANLLAFVFLAGLSLYLRQHNEQRS